MSYLPLLKSLFEGQRILLVPALLAQGSIIPVFADTELNIPGYRMAWHDEFQGDAVNAEKWTVNVGANVAYRRTSDGRWVEPHWFEDAFEPWLQFSSINDERQYYSPNNVEVVDGVLEIRADRETVANPVGWYDPGYHLYTSGKLNTAQTFQFQFGIVRIRAQLPEGKGLWPALWMLNAPDPWFWDDEIDIMEARGSLPTITTSAHHFKVGGGNQYNFGEVDTGINLQTNFAEYSLLWEPTFLRTWVNQQEVFFDTQAIPQNPMFLIINAAVGGMFDGFPTAENDFPTYFKIDWVRVWQPASTPSDLASGDFEDFQGLQWPNWNTVGDSNITPYAGSALHHSHSVRIDSRTTLAGPPPATGTNLFTNGTAGQWDGYLNQLTSDGSVIGGGSDSLVNFPATVGLDSIVLPVHQTAPSPRANAVAYRQIGGGAVQGRTLRFSGSVSIEEPFPANASALAFIRIFNADFSFTDVVTTVTLGGGFSLEATIPESGIPFVQVGLETTGTTGSPGRLAATGLSFMDTLGGSSPEELPTGLNQTVLVSPGQMLQYGVLAANHPTEPIGPAAEGRMVLEFLDANGAVLATESTVLVDANSGPETAAFSIATTTPAHTTAARLRLERVVLDENLDTAGSFLIDAAFLHAPVSTELPVFTALPPSTHTLNAGGVAGFNLGISSPTPVEYRWYRGSEMVSTEKNLHLQTHPDSSGTYFVVASNEAGPVISSTVDLIVLNPDSDGDGFTDYEEIFITRTDPFDPTSTFRLTDFAVSGAEVELTFMSVSGVTYRVGASADLENWQYLGDALSATAAETTVIETLPPLNPPLRFFRIEVVP